MARRILIVDDEGSIRESLKGVLRDEGYEAVTAEDAPQALKMIDEDPPDLILFDIWMPKMDGMEALEKVKEAHPTIPIIMISGHGTIETAVKATKRGAYDFLEKPLSAEKVVLTVEHALTEKALLEENVSLRRRMETRLELIGTSAAMNDLRAHIDRIAPANSWVLITGEDGTGKELVARTIHARSPRARNPFVDVNCAAIPEDLIESELFGYEKGAFTGATSRKKGKFDLAHTGTLFLDEIGDMSLKTQAKILRILEEHRFERVGGTEPVDVDVRVIAATNKNLEREIEKGRFRKDLYYRINVIPIRVPSLRERREDIPLFAGHFIHEFAAENGKEEKSFTPDALREMSAYAWPGNVRELRNLVERLIIMTQGKVIDAPEVREHLGRESTAASGGEGADAILSVRAYTDARERFEREFIARKLKENGGNVSRTAAIIGMTRENLSRKIKSLKIDK